MQQQRTRIVSSAFAAGGLVVAGASGALAAPGDNANDNAAEHVEICHALGSPDTAGNGYNKIAPASSGALHGHADWDFKAHTASDNGHAADIIPPFTYTVDGAEYEFPGQNWDDDTEAFWNAGCEGEIDDGDDDDADDDNGDDDDADDDNGDDDDADDDNGDDDDADDDDADDDDADDDDADDDDGDDDNGDDDNGDDDDADDDNGDDADDDNGDDNGDDADDDNGDDNGDDDNGDDEADDGDDTSPTDGGPETPEVVQTDGAVAQDSSMLAALGVAMLFAGGATVVAVGAGIGGRRD